MHTLIPLCLALLASAGQPPGAPGQRPQRSFEEVSRRANEVRASGRFQEAIPLYRAALRRRPKWEEGWWYLGTLHYDLDRYAEGQDAFRRYVALQPEAGAAWAFLALCEYRLKEYQPALQHLERALHLGLGTHAELHRVTRYHAALLLTRAGDFQRANDNLEELAQAGASDPALNEVFGLSLLRLKLLPHEIPAEQRELVLLAGRAASAHAGGRVQEARLHYADLVARFPSTPNVHYAYGIFLAASDADAALEQFKRELALSPDHVDARLQLAYEALKRGDYDAGLPYAEGAARRAPRLFTARNAYGRLLLGKGEVGRAIEELEAGVALQPGSPPLHFALAQAYERGGRKQDAERQRVIFQRLEELRRAIEQAETQARLKPGDAQLRRELAAAYERAGRRTDAQREQGAVLQLERAPQADPPERQGPSDAPQTREVTP